MVLNKDQRFFFLPPSGEVTELEDDDIFDKDGTVMSSLVSLLIFLLAAEDEEEKGGGEFPVVSGEVVSVSSSWALNSAGGSRI